MSTRNGIAHQDDDMSSKYTLAYPYFGHVNGRRCPCRFSNDLQTLFTSVFRAVAKRSCSFFYGCRLADLLLSGVFSVRGVAGSLGPAIREEILSRDRRANELWRFLTNPGRLFGVFFAAELGLS